VQAAEAIITKHRVVNVVQIGIHATVREETKHRYGQRPAQTFCTTTVQAEARMDQAVMAQTMRR
jgi:hypothetical protein